MREIKFRAWNGEGMFYGGFSIHATGNALEDMITPLEIMQFTGLKDKNGKEIYEGDIVTSQYTMPSTVFWDDETCSFCFGVGAYLCEQQSIYPDEEWTVIGNIHKNPELLEEENENP